MIQIILISISSIFLYTEVSLAYIPPLKMILDRTAENSGKGIYTINLELEFSDGSNSAMVKENWLVEGDKNLKLSAVGLKELKGFNLNFLYQGNVRWSKRNGIKESQKISPEFLEKWHHFRNLEVMQNQLFQSDVISRDVDSISLSRVMGVIAYSIGKNINDYNSARVWIEQDQFSLRKLRLSSGAELSIDSYGSYSRNLHYPRERTIKWGQNSVTLKTFSVQSRNEKQSQLFSSQSLESSNSDSLSDQPIYSSVEEFYRRFR